MMDFENLSGGLVGENGKPVLTAGTTIVYAKQILNSYK